MKCTSAIVFLLNFFFAQSELLWNFSPSSKEVFHAYVNEKTHSIQVFPSIQVNPIAGEFLNIWSNMWFWNKCQGISKAYEISVELNINIQLCL
ncbi:unnamed protein product [Trichobilharzia szidati]|nr:unnamed protein product [Trichobilharzia szidati]